MRRYFVTVSVRQVPRGQVSRVAIPSASETPPFRESHDQPARDARLHSHCHSIAHGTPVAAWQDKKEDHCRRDYTEDEQSTKNQAENRCV